MAELNKQDPKKFFLPVLIILLCQTALFVLFLAFSIPLGMEISLRTDIDDLFIRFAILLAGLILLVFISIKFLQKCVNNPSRTRNTVLLGIVSFLCTVGLKLFTSTAKLTNVAYDRYFYDFTIIMMFTSLYLFVIFGITVLINPEVDQKTRNLKIFTDVLMIIPYCTFFTANVINFFATASAQEFISDVLIIAEILQYVFVLYCLVVLLIMAIKSISISKRTSEENHKKALISLGISFFILVGVYLLIIYNSIGDYSKELEIIVLSASVISFYFIYRGIVAPPSKN